MTREEFIQKLSSLEKTRQQLESELKKLLNPVRIDKKVYDSKIAEINKVEDEWMELARNPNWEK